MKKKLTRLGKFISLILRHKPEMIGIELDRNGWANVDELINGISRSGDVENGKEERINFEILEEIVRNNSKKRYEFNEDFTKIRACQGHSIDVDLEFKAVKPPKILYHGTADRFLEQIKKEGIKKKSRQFVHLSETEETAYSVGQRHGKPFIIKVLAEKMYENGKEFFISKNGVWLTDDIEVKYLEF